MSFTKHNNIIRRSILLLEENLDILKSLICSLLHLEDNDSITVRVLNPINLPDQIEGKTYIMDIEVLWNNELFVNLEMQINDLGDHELRSLQYLCRAYDNLCSGDEYKETRKAIHISFVDFGLIKEDKTEFYSRYLLKNEKSGSKYTERFDLRVVRMKCSDNATAEDKKYGIDKWVRIFKATTWEEIKMIAEKSEAQTNAAAVLYTANLDDVRRRHAQAYEDYLRDQRRHERKEQDLTRELEEAKRRHEQTLEDYERDQRVHEKKEQDLTKKLEEAIKRIAELEGRGDTE